jgi:hypothetical protein
MDKRPLALPSYLNFFEKSPIDLCTENFLFSKVLAHSKPTTHSPINFTINSLDSALICPDSIQCCLKLKILSGGAALGANASDNNNDFVTTINSLSSSVFSDVLCSVNNSLIQSFNGLYPFYGHIQNVLNNNISDLKTRRLFTYDLPGTIDSLDATTVVSRSLDFANGGVCELNFYLDFSIFGRQKALPPNTKIDLKFFPSKSTFSLMSQKENTHSLEIDDFYLNVKYIKTENSMLLNILETLNHTNYENQFNKIDAFSSLIPQGVKTCTIPNLFRGRLPTHILFALTNNDQHEQKSSPLNFKPHDLSGYQFEINGSIFPQPQYDFSFKNGKVNDIYAYTMDTLGISNSLNCIDLSRFKDGYCLGALNLINDSVSHSHLYPTKEGVINLTLQFETVLPKALSLIVIGLFPAYLIINKTGQTSLEYS